MTYADLLMLLQHMQSDEKFLATVVKFSDNESQIDLQLVFDRNKRPMFIQDWED